MQDTLDELQASSSSCEKLKIENLKLKADLEKHEKFECTIRNENPKDTILKPCGHAFCSVCVRKWTSQPCPNCRGAVTETQKLFLE